MGILRKIKAALERDAEAKQGQVALFQSLAEANEHLVAALIESNEKLGKALGRAMADYNQIEVVRATAHASLAESLKQIVNQARAIPTQAEALAQAEETAEKLMARIGIKDGMFQPGGPDGS
jgi:hypothetical protein